MIDSLTSTLLVRLQAASVALSVALFSAVACTSSPGQRESTSTTAPAANESPAVVVASNAAPFAAVNLDACLKIARKESAADEAVCPGFVSDGLAEMIATCEQVGGRLAPVPSSSLTALDVNGDGKVEVLYDATENYGCVGAPSVFSCGSLGCPVSLFERRADGWSAIGSLSSMDVPGAEVLRPQAGVGYGMLRGGCAGERPCEEWTYYQRTEGSYRPAMIEVRGHWVDIANDGLWTLVSDAPVLASPSPTGAVLARYPIGTDVVVIGTARGAPYKYVSPCNACQSGFIDPSVLRKTN